MSGLLVVTATTVEQAALAAPGRDVVVTGVGPAAAAAATSAELAGGGYRLVLCAGIGGGFASLPAGALAVASRIVFADLGAESDAGFVPLSGLGLGTDSYDPDPALAVALAERTGGHLGTVLTVATVTGTAGTAADLGGRFPDAVAEGMEGAGVAAAAVRHGVAFAEVRAISNPVGPRDRAAWQLPAALAALTRALAGLEDWLDAAAVLAPGRTG